MRRIDLFMKVNKQILLYSVIFICAVCLFIFTMFFSESGDDSFWNGLATGIIFICAVRIYFLFKYKNNEKYAKEINIQNNDERNRFLANKAKSIAFYLYMIVSGILVIILRAFGEIEASVILGYSVCGLLILYLVVYFVIRKKY